MTDEKNGTEERIRTLSQDETVREIVRRAVDSARTEERRKCSQRCLKCEHLRTTVSGELGADEQRCERCTYLLRSLGSLRRDRDALRLELHVMRTTWTSPEEHPVRGELPKDNTTLLRFYVLEPDRTVTVGDGGEWPDVAEEAVSQMMNAGLVVGVWDEDERRLRYAISSDGIRFVDRYREP